MLELHHLKHHKDKGENTMENLITLCNVHHDEEHRHSKSKIVVSGRERLPVDTLTYADTPATERGDGAP